MPGLLEGCRTNTRKSTAPQLVAGIFRRRLPAHLPKHERSAGYPSPHESALPKQQAEVPSWRAPAIVRPALNSRRSAVRELLPSRQSLATFPTHTRGLFRIADSAFLD